MRSFVKMKSSRNAEISLSLIMPLSRIFNAANMSFNAFRENKICGFTVVFSSCAAVATMEVC